jgi:SAM-dependent methyltransferase
MAADTPPTPDLDRLNEYLASRPRKALKLEAILEEHVGPDLSARTVLDVGCSPGWIVQYLQHRFRLMVGVDVQIGSLANTVARAAVVPQLIAADAARLPFADQSFDVVIYAQVYEHVPDQQGVASEIARVLRTGGVCLFTGPNRLAIMEEHFRLPFLSWVPTPVASAVVRAMRRGAAYDIRPRTLWSIRKLWRGFRIHDYTANMLRSPERYYVNEHVALGRWLARLPSPLLRALMPLYPNYNWILEKRDRREPGADAQGLRG